MASWRKTSSLFLALLLYGLTAARSEPEAAANARPFFFALSVADVERSADWYTRVLGFEPVKSIGEPGDAVQIRLLRRPGALLELVRAARARPFGGLEPAIGKRYLLHGVFKIGFQVEDLDRYVERLAGLGVGLRGEVISEPDVGLRSLQVEDPDGTVVQIFQVLPAAGTADD